MYISIQNLLLFLLNEVFRNFNWSTNNIKKLIKVCWYQNIQHHKDSQQSVFDKLTKSMVTNSNVLSNRQP